MATSHRQTRSIAGYQRPSLRTAKDFIWQAAGENFSARFHVTPELITLKAKGKVPKMPLLLHVQVITGMKSKHALN